MLLCVSVGCPGIISAVRRNRPIDHAARVFSVFGVSMPVFWLGLMLLLLFYRTWDGCPVRAAWTSTPTAGAGDRALFDRHSRRGQPRQVRGRAPAHPHAGFLPVLRVPGDHYEDRPVLDDFRDGLDFITTARANGISEAAIILKHCLKNSLIRR